MLQVLKMCTTSSKSGLYVRGNIKPDIEWQVGLDMETGPLQSLVEL